VVSGALAGDVEDGVYVGAEVVEVVFYGFGGFEDY
jgi:hypothetical protein